MPNIFERLKEKKLKTIVYPIHEPWARYWNTRRLFESKIN
jgi:hypothetical protein